MRTRNSESRHSSALAGLPIGAQNVDPKALLSPPADAWLTYHGDYTGQRHSKLTEITPENIAEAQTGLAIPDEPGNSRRRRSWRTG